MQQVSDRKITDQMREETTASPRLVGVLPLPRSVSNYALSEMKGLVTALLAVAMVGCGHDAGTPDTARRFVGEWVCDSGTRNLDCDGVVTVVDLASGLPTVLRFRRGEASDLVLTIPSAALAPGLPGGPSCEFELNSPNGDDAFLLTAPTCVDDNGQNIVVHEGLVRLPLHLLYVTTNATTSTGCRVDNEARCWRSVSDNDMVEPQ